MLTPVGVGRQVIEIAWLKLMRGCCGRGDAMENGATTDRAEFAHRSSWQERFDKSDHASVVVDIGDVRGRAHREIAVAESLKRNGLPPDSIHRRVIALPLVLRREQANHHRFLGQIGGDTLVINVELVVCMKHPVAKRSRFARNSYVTSERGRLGK